MSDNISETQKLDLGNAAAVMVLALGMIGIATLFYYLIDILVVFFLGLVVAAALQPGHVRLSRLGVPTGLAVLLIYLLFIIGITLIVLFVEPVLITQFSTVASGLPTQYTTFVDWLHASPTPLLQRLGAEIPSFEVLLQNIAAFAPTFFANVVGIVTSTANFFIYLTVVLAVGFYWTMEVPRLERLILSMLSVTRRPQVLGIWHEIESKLGAFIWGQGLAMLTMGVASGIGYFLLGLPNVLALAVLAGLCEGVPLVGPILGAIPAVFAALPLGLTSVLLVIGFSVLLQLFESNVLIPRVMSHTVGISPLVQIFAILALGSMLGISGVFIAVPLAVVVQVLLDRIVINPELAPEPPLLATNTLTTLHARVQALQQQMRLRLRGRDTRMGIDPQTPDHVVDATDQQIEREVERVERMLVAVQDHIESTGPPGETQSAQLNRAIRQIEEAIDLMETMVKEVQEHSDLNETKILECQSQ